jgi:hypothetical protein
MMMPRMMRERRSGESYCLPGGVASGEEAGRPERVVVAQSVSIAGENWLDSESS